MFDRLGHFFLLPARARFAHEPLKAGKCSLYVKNEVDLDMNLHILKRQVLRFQLLTRSGCGDMTF